MNVEDAVRIMVLAGIVVALVVTAVNELNKRGML